MADENEKEEHALHKKCMMTSKSIVTDEERWRELRGTGESLYRIYIHMLARRKKLRISQFFFEVNTSLIGEINYANRKNINS